MADLYEWFAPELKFAIHEFIPRQFWNRDSRVISLIILEHLARSCPISARLGRDFGLAPYQCAALLARFSTTSFENLVSPAIFAPIGRLNIMEEKVIEPKTFSNKVLLFGNDDFAIRSDGGQFYFCLKTQQISLVHASWPHGYVYSSQPDFSSSVTLRIDSLGAKFWVLPEFFPPINMSRNERISEEDKARLMHDILSPHRRFIIRAIDAKAALISWPRVRFPSGEYWILDPR
jgi:hypothetical protein